MSVSSSSELSGTGTIIEMGHSLGMKVVAEGVETLAQLEFLRSAHCDYAQGQLFGQPCSADVLGALVARQVSTGASPFPGFDHAKAAGLNSRA